MIIKGLAQADTNPFGTIPVPSPLSSFGNVSATDASGIGNFLNLILRIMIIGAAIYALFNFVLAGYAFLSAGDDPKKIAGAWAKIWQSALGLAFAAGAFVLAAIFGWLIFGKPEFILNPTIPTP